MTMVNGLKAAAVVLGLATAITSTFVWGDATGGKTTVGGLNPGNVKLSDDIMSNRFTKQPVLTYETQTGDTLFAVQIKPTLPAVPRARDIVVVVDTSASQAGKFLAVSRMVVDQLVQDSSPSDRVSLWSINTPAATRNLSSGLKDAHNKAHVVAMTHALDSEYASGAVDLKNGIEKVLGDFDGKVLRQQVVVFIGDAESACAPLSENERYQLANKVREAKVQFFAVPIGSAINALNMHTLATGTGGGVVRLGDHITNAKKAVAEVVKELQQSMNVPVLFPTKWNFATELAERYPTRLPPLRADAPTLVVGKFPKGKIPAKFEGTIEGRLGGVQTSVSVSEVVPAASPQNFFLNSIVRQWSESSIKEAPSILRADRTLAMAYEQGRLNRDECLTQSQFALGMSQINAARNLAIAAEKIDYNDSEVKALIRVINKLDKGELTIEKLKAATGQQIGVRYEKRDNGELVAVRVALDEIAADPVPAPKVPNTVPVGDPQALLKQEQARRAILEQQVRLTVEETLSRGRDLLRNADPRAAKDLLLAQRDSIKSNPDIGEALRTKLLDQMDKLLTDVGQRGEKIVREKAEENERIARARAKVMSIDNDRSREERTRDRIKAFSNLMAQARYEDAYREALVLNQESVNEGRPVPIESAATYQINQAGANLREMRELTRIREDRFLLTMLQVEKSHIPYPDEPPVHFPPSKVWKDLTDIRKRYANSELDSDLPPRVLRRMEFLKSALENPIPEIPAGEQPLPFLLENIAGFASPPGFDRDPSRKVTILINASEFKKEDMMFDPEKQQIKFPSKLVGVSLATVLRLISEQIDGTYWVRRDYIEIVPANYAIKEKVVRVFPVGDLIIGIPNAINQSSLSQSLAVLGAQFSLGGGGQPIGGIGGFQGGALGLGGGGGAGGAGGGGAPIGGVFNGGARGAGGGVAGFGGGIQGQFGNLGGQFGFQGADYGPTLVALITEVIAKNEWTINNNDVIGQGGMGAMDVDPAAAGLPADQLNRIGYWPPSRGLIITGTSRFHRGESSKLKKKDLVPANFIPGNNQVNAGNPAGNVADAKVEPKNPKNVVAVAKGEIDVSATVQEIIANNKNLDPETLYQSLLSRGKAEPGYIIACVDFMVKCRQFKHAAELLKTSLRTGIIAEPWAQESLAIALEGSQASAEEIERAKLSAIDLAPKSPYAYLKASKAMAEMGDPDRALKYCRLAARFEPNLPDPYINALAYASDKKATLDADVSTWAAGNLLTRDWSTDAAEYHLRAHEHLKEMSAKFAAKNMLEGTKMIQAVLDNEKNRDLVIELLWSGQADLDLKVREPIGTTCSSLNKRTSGGGVLQGDDFTQKDDNRGETYTAAEAFTGTYLVSVDKVWGRSLDNKVNIKVTKNQGTPEQTVELHTLNLKEQTTLSINFESGRRKNLASVPPIGVPVDSMRKPEREQEVMNKLRAMTNGTSPGMVGMSGGAGTAAQHQGLMGSDESQSPFLEMSVNTNVASSVPGGFEMSKQTVVSKDGRLRIKVAPVFQTAGGTSQTKLKLDFIPGSE